MNGPKKTLFNFSVAAFLAMAVVYLAPAQQPSFEVVISSPTAVSTEGTPVRVAVTIVNHSRENFLFHEPACGPEAAGITVRDEHRTVLEPRVEFRERPDTIPCGFGAFIEPAKKYSRQVAISRWFDLSRPGRYFVQAAPAGRSGNVSETQQSNVLEIQIVPLR